MDIFPDTSLGVENPQSREEDEELEEQRRRQEELADLLAAGIHAFNYDESTMNSSVTSVEEVPPTKTNFKYEDSGKTTLDNMSVGQNYKDITQQEQLQVLYDIRVREINTLRDELHTFKEEKKQEIKVLKNKLTLSEAEIRHLQISLTNCESLLVEKTEIIGNLKHNLLSKDEEIADLLKKLEQQNLEICTYKSTVNELQLKLSDNNPFNTGTRRLNSEELQKVHQDKIVKLETLLQEQTKKVEVVEKEKLSLEEDVKKLIALKNQCEEDNNMTIMALSKKLQTTQQQCKDLFLLGEAIKRESDHFKERIEQFELNKFDASGDEFCNKNMDKDTMLAHIEKLRRMLLDKDVELNTLKAKLKFYNSDLAELLEYRKILDKMYSCEVKPCNNSEHEELILFMQGQLQSYQQAVEDRNNQIITLNSVNKELQEKIEEMIQQTRIDIQNLSQKYSLPKLETMSNELKNAEETINTLRQQLLEKDDDYNTKIKELQIQKDDEKNLLINEIEEFKNTELQLIEENDRVKTQLQKICLKLGLSEAEIFESDDVHELKSLKSKYGKIHDQLQHVLVHLENMNFKRTNFNIIFKLRKQIQNYLNVLNDEKFDQKEIRERLEQWDNMVTDFVESLRHSENIELSNSSDRTTLEETKLALETELKSCKKDLEDAKTENAKNTRTIQKLNDHISNLNKCYKIVEENKHEVEKQLENTQKQLNDAKQENINFHKEMDGLNESVVREDLLKELKDVEKVLDKSGETFSKSEAFQAQMLKAEISLRDRLQEESVKKMQKIEEQYKKVIVEKSELHNKEKDKWKRQEVVYRKQFAAVLEECGKKMEELENENVKLLRQVNVITQEYNILKSNAKGSIEKYNKIIGDCKKAMEESNKKWIALFDYYSLNIVKVEKLRNKSVKSVLKKITGSEIEIKSIENVYNDKINKIKSEGLKM